MPDPRAEPGKKGRLSVRKLFLPAALLLCLLLLPMGCLQDFFEVASEQVHGEAPKDDLELAEQALKERDTSEAEMRFERYLRKNPAGEQRWEVWQRLLAISLNMRQDKATAKEYLEIMLEEFASDAPKRRSVALNLARLCNETGAYARAVSLWEALGHDGGLPDEERATVYRLLSQAYLRRLEFTMATDVLELCLQLPVAGSTKADCLYSLAETQMFTDDLKAAEQSLHNLLALPEALPERRVLGIFMLADVMDQQMRYKEALKLFESIRDSYPNSKVVEVRLLSLKQKLDKRPDVVPK
ncbi:tetratricopeptide repeat protein [Desulfovibrio sp. OttesenSCG-928-A18]|nr:tetratricopeptide repeat protein [Desulfovibrio sp. OttesenSCG-928-A18]